MLTRLVRRAEAAGARKSFEQGTHVITELAISNPNIAENVPGQDIKIKVGRDLKMAGPGKDRLDETRIIEHRIAGFGIREQIDEGDVIRLDPGESADDKVEISR